MRELRSWGVDGIITNDVRRAVSLLKENDETC
jgi:glycerophosphoryl diester phosphodiesterase